MLVANRHFVSIDKLNWQISHLNGPDAIKRITTEWEIAVLHGLSQLGNVEYEPRIDGTVAIDALFRSLAGTALIDITTVSDRGLDEQNPIEKLCEEVANRVRQHGLNPNKFGVEAKGNFSELYLTGPKPRLGIPSPDKFEAMFDGFTRFLESTRVSSERQRFHLRGKAEKGLTISFDPASQFFSCSHLDYTVAFTAKRNPIRNRLDDKEKQMRRAKYDGLMGIILCDAGCSLLGRRGRPGMNLGCDEIVTKFLQDHPSIAFVISIRVVSDASPSIAKEHLRLACRDYLSASHHGAAPLAKYLVGNISQRIPSPENLAINAYSVADEGGSFNGGFTRMGSRIKISARAVVEVLSGRITHQDFMRENQAFVELVRRYATQGRMLDSVTIEKTPERDDDWLEFSFSEPDPAVSPYPQIR